MAKLKSSRSDLRGVGRDVVAFIVNHVAFADYDECCSAVRIAERLDKDPKRFKTTLKRLAAEGWITLTGTSRLRVYPTVAALRWADPKLREREAQRLLATVRKRAARR